MHDAAACSVQPAPHPQALCFLRRIAHTGESWHPAQAEAHHASITHHECAQSSFIIHDAQACAAAATLATTLP